MSEPVGPQVFLNMEAVNQPEVLIVVEKTRVLKRA